MKQRLSQVEIALLMPLTERFVRARDAGGSGRPGSVVPERCLQLNTTLLYRGGQEADYRLKNHEHRWQNEVSTRRQRERYFGNFKKAIADYLEL